MTLKLFGSCFHAFRIVFFGTTDVIEIIQKLWACVGDLVLVTVVVWEGGDIVGGRGHRGILTVSCSLLLVVGCLIFLIGCLLGFNDNIMNSAYLVHVGSLFSTEGAGTGMPKQIYIGREASAPVQHTRVVHKMRHCPTNRFQPHPNMYQGRQSYPLRPPNSRTRGPSGLN